MYPNTHFFEGKPLFFTDSANPLKRSQLHEAYTYFGKVHVANVEQRRFLTIFQTGHNSNGQPIITFDGVLDKVAQAIGVLEKHFGTTAAVVTNGPDVNFEEISGDVYPSPLPRVPYWKFESATPVPQDTYRSSTELRKRIRQQGFAKISSKDGESAIALYLTQDSLIRPEYFGKLDTFWEDLRVLE